jgi:hypothetical protein
MKRLRLALLLTAVGLMAGVKPLEAQAPRERLFAGKWTLEFSADTRPGGETLRAGTITISPQNLHFAASRGEFAVSDAGQFSWLERTSGQWQSDATLIDSGGQRSSPSQTNEPLLKAAGQLDRQRKLTLTMQWTHGSGPFAAGDGTPGVLTVSADGGLVTTMFKGRTVSYPSKYLTTEWTLAPTSITKRDISPNEQEERAVYSASRRRTLNDFGAGPLPVGETIRVEQVRPLKLVPRG